MALLIAFVACDGTDETAAPPGPLKGTLELELRDTVDVTIVLGAEDRMTLTMVPSAGYGLLSTTELQSEGRVERFPEASSVLYTAKLSSPPQPGGPCDTDPISLAVSLHRQGDSPMVMGGLSIYCGQDRWHGVPVRVLRVAGVLTP
jgi:hypothetical protein